MMPSSVAVEPSVAAVQLQDGRDLAGEGIGASLDHAERCGIG